MNIEQSYSRLPAELHSGVRLDPAKSPELLAWNGALAADLGIGQLGDDPDECARIFSGGPLPDEFEPVAFAYAGHQFGVFVPQLGDGRAALLGEIVDPSGRRFDVQLKGSGRTPYSRGGDGRSWLGPVIREYLVSEAMHRLGVPTTRALAAVATGERVYREDAMPGAVFTRVAASHLRIGTFQFLAARQRHAELGALADYAIDRHYPECSEADNPHSAFFDAVVGRQAELVARWMALGFIHGVMNTDNASIAGETIDYGPCAFMDEYRHDKVFSSIDHHGRYAFANQPAIAQWNLARLAECLLMISDARNDFEATLSDFPGRYEEAYLGLMRTKLGLTGSEPGDDRLVADWLIHLEDSGLDYTLSFRRLAERVDAGDDALFADVEKRWRQRIRGRPPADVAAAMNAVNPLFIPRNHRVEAAIQAAVEGDTTAFEELRTVLAEPYREHSDLEHLADAPEPEERVLQTFCGT